MEGNRERKNGTHANGGSAILTTVVKYNENIGQMKTHHVLPPKIEPIYLSWNDTKDLKKANVIVCRKANVQFGKGAKKRSSVSIFTKKKHFFTPREKVKRVDGP